MKTVSFLCFLIPVAAFGQTSVGSRVSSMLSEGIQGGAQGLYLKQVNGPIVAIQQDRYVFDPANAVAIFPLLYAMEGVRIGAITLDTPIQRYLNGATSCPNPPVLGGAEPLSTALREMMWHSDNARMHEIQAFFERAGIDAFSRTLGLRSTSQPTIPGCQTPGRTVLAELVGIWEAIAAGNLPTFDRNGFLRLLAGKPQALVESTDYDHLWDTDIPRIMRQEAPQGTTDAQMVQFQNSMEVQYKSGITLRCREAATCTEILEDRSIAGWAKIPFCSGGLTSSRDYVFGLFISGALDTSWSPGKLTAAERNYTASRAELLRELIRDGLGSCFGGDVVLVSPVANSTLNGRTVVFSWSNAKDATGYRLDLGTAPAGTQLGTMFTSVTSAVATNLPCDGRTIYARLLTRIREQYINPKDYTFRACSIGGPLIITPVPGSTIAETPVTFTWQAVQDADFYRFTVGSTLGGNDIEAAGPTTNSFTVTNFPTDGRVVFVRLQAHLPAGYGAINDFAYNNVTGSAPAISSVVNAATRLPNLSPACLAVLNGGNFASDVVVSVNNVRAQVVSTAGNQITFVIPPASGTGTRTVVISSGGATSLPFPVSLADGSPGVYSPLLDTGGNPLPAGRVFKPGDTIVLRAVGLGPLGSDGRPLLSVRAEIGGVQAAISSFSSSAISPGVVQITLTVPSTAPSGTQQLIVKAGSGVSNGAPVLIAGPAIAGILNGASFAGTKVAPGSLIALFGTDLATEDRFGMYPAALLPGTGVITINGVSAPLFDVVASAGQINLLVPFETPTTGAVPVIVTNAAGTSATFRLGMAPAAPGIFRIGDPSNAQRKNAAALVANTAWRAMPSSMAGALGMPQDCKASGISAAAICGEPAAAGSPIQIYVTGLGRATPNGNPVGNTLRTGDVAPADGSVLYRTVETPRVTIGGIDAEVAFSGIAPGFAGLYQINVTIPGGVAPGDDVPVTIDIGGASDTATIAIRP